MTHDLLTEDGDYNVAAINAKIRQSVEALKRVGWDDDPQQLTMAVNRVWAEADKQRAEHLRAEKETAQ